MKKYKAILFDMDGTLIPMDMKEFSLGYFQFLGKKLEEFNIPYDKLVATIWEGTGAMARNDGSKKNADVFWKKFDELIPGTPLDRIMEKCEDFYSHEFDQAKMFTQDNPFAKEAVKVAHEKAPIVALATNPLFPMAGQKTRMEWIGLSSEDFDLVTSYETDSYCKPSPEYFLTVCERLNVKPEECLMVGNDEYEDMYACTQAGMDGYLVTDTMIASEKHPWNGPKGTFKELLEMLKEM